MAYRQTKVSKYFIQRAEEVASTPVYYIEDPVERDHARGRISFHVGLLQLLGGEKRQARRQFEMWRYLRSKVD